MKTALRLFCLLLCGSQWAVAQLSPCATTLPDEIDPATGAMAKMGPSCTTYLYGSYGGTCDFTNCNVPNPPQAACPDYRIPLVFTVLRSNAGSTTYNAAVLSTVLDELNTYYANARMTFVQAEAVRFINDSDLQNFYTAGTDPEDGADDDVEITAYDLPNVINVYVAEDVHRGTVSTCGYAYFPTVMGSGASVSNNNRAVMSRDCVEAGDPSLAHELGHFFGLQHTHNGASGNTPNEASNGSDACDFGPPNSSLPGNDPNNPWNIGDGIADTPPDPLLLGKVNSACQYIGTYTPAPSQPLLLNNIMSYTNYNACEPNTFTDCQLRKMNDVLLQCRDYLCAANIALDF